MEKLNFLPVSDVFGFAAVFGQIAPIARSSLPGCVSRWILFRDPRQIRDFSPQ